MNVNEYRKRHPRCRTCEHALTGSYCWYCRAKNTRHRGELGNTTFKGILCPLYAPKEEKE